MAEKIVFTGATLQSFTRKSTGGSIKFTAAFTDQVARAMSWADVPECLTGATLDGDLHAQTLILSPNEKELRKHECEIEVSRVFRFQTVRMELEGKRGKGHRTELHFTALFSDPNGARKLEQYIISCGKSRVTVSYTKAAEQPELPMSTEEQRAAASEEND